MQSIRKNAAILQIFSSILLIFIGFALMIYIPIKTLYVGLAPKFDASADILLGFSFIFFLVFSIITAKGRISGLNSFIMLVYWFMADTDWFLRNTDRMLVGYIPTLTYSVVVLVVLVFNTGLNFAYMIGESIYLKKHKRSAFWGPILNRFADIKRIKRIIMDLPSLRRSQLKNALKIGLFLFFLVIPGILIKSFPQLKSVEITPKNYDIKFNFWASSNLNEDYTPEMITQLNKHHVNLDISIFLTDKHKIDILEQFEQAMPNITYRTTLTPPHFGDLTDSVVSQMELLIPYIQNGTLDQWRGFAFDIEGDHYRYWLSYKNIEEAMEEWNKSFNYIYYNASKRINKTIDLENVGSHIFRIDKLFDNDLDNQAIEGYVSDEPDRFSTYAPMVYRCMTDFDKCTNDKPNLFNPWHTSYSIYQALYALNRSVPENKLGIYLGITNCTCYSCNIPQSEPATYGNRTGLGNLIRDTLIAKHFGVKEVTYFLQFSIGNPKILGAFDSYGADWLDILNYSVNAYPPKTFHIYYNSYDAELTQQLYRDVLGNLSRPLGLIMGILAFIGACIICFLIIDKQKIRN
ncbi:MAG: hypothetical protein ACTSXF_02865 [Promethearchaeota archaeon]